MKMEATRVQIDAPDAATAAYIMSELVGRFDAELVSPAAAGASWTVTLRLDRNEHDLLSAAIGTIERALRTHELSEATVRFGRRSYTIHNPDVEPRRSAA
jgi:hypothetical protein